MLVVREDEEVGIICDLFVFILGFVVVKICDMIFFGGESLLSK